MSENEHHTQFNWTVLFDPDEKQIFALRKQLRAYNESKVQVKQGRTLAILLHNDFGELVGGASGWLWGACLEIDYLWVHEDRRGQGIGRRLMDGLEEAAVAHGCLTTVLDTYSWQAPEFYIKLGCNVFGVVEGYPEENKKFHLKKQLA